MYASLSRVASAHRVPAGAVSGAEFLVLCKTGPAGAVHVSDYVLVLVLGSGAVSMCWVLVLGAVSDYVLVLVLGSGAVSDWLRVLCPGAGVVGRVWELGVGSGLSLIIATGKFYYRRSFLYQSIYLVGSMNCVR